MAEPLGSPILLNDQGYRPRLPSSFFDDIQGVLPEVAQIQPLPSPGAIGLDMVYAFSLRPSVYVLQAAVDPDYNLSFRSYRHLHPDDKAFIRNVLKVLATTVVRVILFVVDALSRRSTFLPFRVLPYTANPSFRRGISTRPISWFLLEAPIFFGSSTE